MGNVFLVVDPSKQGMLGVKVEPSPFTGMGEWVGKQRQQLQGSSPLPSQGWGRGVAGAAATAAVRVSGWDGWGVVGGRFADPSNRGMLGRKGVLPPSPSPNRFFCLSPSLPPPHSPLT
ncbi:unnamed protein product [Closterium sp. NIES-65]|nr:unnamed protein product [Closterium sp. NIES-65]